MANKLASIAKTKVEDSSLDVIHASGDIKRMEFKILKRKKRNIR